MTGSYECAAVAAAIAVTVCAAAGALVVLVRELVHKTNGQRRR